VALYEQDIAICEKQDDKDNLAIGLGNVAIQQLVMGEMCAAGANLRRRIAVGQEFKDERGEAIGHRELGRLLAYRGVWVESETELETALEMFEKEKHVQAQGVTWACRALRELLQLRTVAGGTNLKSQISDFKLALAPARRALELADEFARIDYPVERDYTRADWLLGAAYRVAGELDEAERHLHKALQRCRRINMVDHEAET
jgi:tetratricopeptide (TPR) repeat protein